MDKYISYISYAEVADYKASTIKKVAVLDILVLAFTIVLKQSVLGIVFGIAGLAVLGYAIKLYRGFRLEDIYLYNGLIFLSPILVFLAALLTYIDGKESYWLPITFAALILVAAGSFVIVKIRIDKGRYSVRNKSMLAEDAMIIMVLVGAVIIFVLHKFTDIGYVIPALIMALCVILTTPMDFFNRNYYVKKYKLESMIKILR